MNTQTINDKNSVVHVDSLTKSRIAFLSHATGLSEKSLIQELINNVFAIGCNYIKGLNLEFCGEISESRLTIDFSGKSNLIIGSFQIPENDTDATMQEKLKQALTSQIKIQKRCA